MIVRISRELGAGGQTVGEAVAAAIGGTLLDERRIIAAISDRVGYPSDYLESAFERPPTLGQTLLADLARATAMLPVGLVWQAPDEEIIAASRQFILECAAAGHVVVIGPAAMSLRGWRPAGVSILKILLRAARDWRVAQLARRYAIDRDEARRRVDRTDEARRRYQLHYFATDIYDAREYDLVLSTDALGLELAAALVTQAATSLAAAATAASPTGT